ncbi:hypothetical protein ES319_D05G153600v1 [Gossypium barbadense]|uniref:DUF1365 domain-containing protein n=1 Tax=Gossypium barbadense TaxID=3634 RepID=A0A5J5RED3_GOSBA|nr:hypothetical protein ES319_D05G153600v1 [Gossypium barbadense]
MEVFYLLCSILSTFFTSLTLSLLLPFRFLLMRHRLPLSTSQFEPVSLYQGTVWHDRRRPVRHSFRYSVRYALFDLDHAPNTPPDHLSADEARRITKTDGPVFLLTIPPSVGYEQNPLSLYYCYDSEGTDKLLKKCIAEVTNTPWGERVSFVFDPNSDLVAKPLHVSPFMALKLWWKNVSFIQHPRYTNPSYREEALNRDRKLQCCPGLRQNKDEHMQVGGSDSATEAERYHGERFFVWKDAKWPWC